MPRIGADTDLGEQIYISSENYLRSIYKPFKLNDFISFGTQIHCLIPKEIRKTKKTPGQEHSFEGVMVGYSVDCAAYKIFDLRKRKIVEVSKNFCVVAEGCFPFKDKKNWPDG